MRQAKVSRYTAYHLYVNQPETLLHKALQPGIRHRTEKAPTFVVVRINFSSFDNYDGACLNAGSDATLVSNPDGGVVQLRRRADAEKKRLVELRKSGLQKIPAGRVQSMQSLPDAMLGITEPDALYAFVNDVLPLPRD
ncbi:hypothetical protein OKW38_005545 [Paraburkholderia sp. MM5496-R1]|uniref:hypothetical protein n=1 Tax=Paraburkholderia sp. MM5496-R1 TaxID=2991065 RepID=UPI003D1B8D5D